VWDFALVNGAALAMLITIVTGGLADNPFLFRAQARKTMDHAIHDTWLNRARGIPCQSRSRAIAGTRRRAGPDRGDETQSTGRLHVTHDSRNALRRRIDTVEAACEFMLAQPSIGSELIDNLNASNHVRTLLTDLFLADEALKAGGAGRHE
jgi:hypothetical protein